MCWIFLCTQFMLRGLKDKWKLLIFLEGEDVKTDVFSSEVLVSVDPVSGFLMDETLPIEKRSKIIIFLTQCQWCT